MLQFLIVSILDAPFFMNVGSPFCDVGLMGDVSDVAPLLPPIDDTIDEEALIGKLAGGCLSCLPSVKIIIELCANGKCCKLQNY
jgi:hypothetical protein